MSIPNQGPVAPAAGADWLPRIDFVLECSVQDVWPLILNWNEWIPDACAEHVSGEVGQLGEIRKISKMDEQGRVANTFCTQIVQIEPGRRLVSRLLPYEKPVDEMESVSGYTLFNLHELGGQVLVSYETVARMETSLLSAEQVKQRIGKQAHDDVANHWLKEYVPRLRALLKERRPEYAGPA